MALIGEMKYLQIGTSVYEIPTSELPIASSSTLGGIKVGTNLSIDSSTGVLSASFTETDPIFSASAAAGITATDITNWNNKVSDDHKWNDVSLDKTSISYLAADEYIPKMTSSSATSAGFTKATSTPTRHCIAKYDSVNSIPYLKSTTPDASDDSTKVATTAWVTAKGYLTSFTETDPTVPSWAKSSTKPTYTASEVGAVATSAVGAASGVAPLNASQKIDSTYLPSYVDDVIEGYYYNDKFWKEAAHTTEITGEAGKIYVDLSTNKTYRYSGSAFVEVSSGSLVTITRNLTSGTKSAIINIDGTDYDIYSETNTDEKVKTTEYTPDTNYHALIFGSLTASTESKYISKSLLFNVYNHEATLSIGNLYSGYNADGIIDLVQGSYETTLKSATLSADRTILLPDATGTIALTSDIPSIPTNISAFTNDAGYITSSDIPVTSVNGQTGAVTISVPTASSTTPAMDGTAATGSETTFARGDHVHPTDTSRAASTAVTTQAIIDNTGLITYKNSSDTSLYTVQLPLFDGGAGPSDLPFLPLAGGNLTGNLSIGGTTTSTGLLTASGGISTTTLTTSGNTTVGGTLGVTGATTLGNTLGVTGATTVENVTVNGTVDVTQRRCEATLSSAGWYRAVIYNAYDTYSAQGSSGEIVDIDIVWTATNNCGHRIRLFLDYGKVVFLGEESNGTYNIVDKIRYTYSGSIGYIDIHFVGISSGSVPVHFAFDVTTRTYANSYWVAGTFASVADAPTGETVLTTFYFNYNTEGVTDGWHYTLQGKHIRATKTITDTLTNYTTINGFFGYYISGITTPFTMASAKYYVGTTWSIGSGFSISAGILSKTINSFNAYALSTASGSQDVELAIVIEGEIA